MQTTSVKWRSPLRSDHFLQSISAFGLAKVVSWIAGTTLLVLLPRYLSDENVGRLVLGSVLVTLIGTTTELGITTYLAREIAREPERADSLIGNAMAMRIPLSLLGLILTVAVASVAGYDDLTKQVVYLFCIGYLVAPLSTVVNGALQGFHQMKAMACYSALLSSLNFAAAVVIIHVGGGLVELVLAEVVTGVIALAIATRVMLRFTRLSLRFEGRTWRAIVLGGLPFFTQAAGTLAYSKIDVLQLSWMTNDAVVGWYGLAYRLMGIPVFVPATIMMVSFPALAATVSDRVRFQAMARRAIRLVVFASLPMGVGIMVLADKLIVLLGFSEGFANAVILLVILAPHIVLIGVNMQIGTVLNASGGHWKWTTIAIAAAGLSSLANLMAIPVTQALWGNGAIGAAIVTVLTETFLFAASLRLLPAGLLDTATAARAAKCLVAGGMMALALWALRDLSLFLLVPLGAVLYLATAVALRAVSLDDLRELRRTGREVPVASV